PPPPAPVAAPAPPPPPPEARFGGPIVDVGLSRQLDPANYAFGRVGYEIPLVGKLHLIGLVGGAVRWMGNDGGSAFTADALLDYRWIGRVSLGAGAGYWSGNDGQADLIADVGYLAFGAPDGRNAEVFLEGRARADELDNFDDFARIGLGLRFRF
ncbi:MAG TPA: hypothetical protein VI078_02635, partial [bacterium]